MRRLLVPVDFSDRSRVALRFALELARATGGVVHALHVVPPPSDLKRRAEAVLGLPISRVPDEVIARAEAELRVLLAEVADAHAITPRVLPGDEAASVVQVADDERFDLIVLGKLMRDVMTCAHCPVLTLSDMIQA
jgi:nucleotide-binding universal stress UspA family protein